ncbi:unnamed protein product [Nippostrongylus brasiliensis]|uniref:Uncharacterized protein n=1 Tax=Nippostrongylus brasiliensis TaxID=27835 RepID=A0A0N4XYT3_NIPBR|nr:unnamed protein product [Nippostrongylus brasiliensis]
MRINSLLKPADKLLLAKTRLAGVSWALFVGKKGKELTDSDSIVGDAGVAVRNSSSLTSGSELPLLVPFFCT